ncbi:MAG: hypothetical protein J7642_22290 [Cyanobacteria bacterium SBC]|nr:hypothetical protein [Cyanobacteria bacterium SBC]
MLKEYHNADEENISAELQSKIEDFVYQIENCGLYLYEDHERFAAQSLLNYWITRLYRLGYDELDLTLADYDRSLAPELKDEDYPYMGLKPFTENDREKFYGRDRLINELIFHLKQHSFISVVGSPKTGKSSLVFAGLVPQLKAGAIEGSDRWYYYPAIEPGDRPLENLAKILKPDATEDWLQQQVTAFKNNPEHLSQLVRELHPDRSVFLVVDRFEELFNLCFDIEERQAFIDNLVNYLESRNPQNFLILTIQSNFIWKIEQFQDETFNKLLKTSQIKITALEDSEVKEAIEHPAESVGLVFDLGLVDALIKDFSGDIDALPLLQFSLLKLWEYREQNRVTWDSYQKLGRGGGGLAFSNSAEQFYKSLSEIEKSLCRSILLRLVRPLQGFQPRNRQVKRQAIQKLATDDLSISDLEKMLEKLVDENLIYKIPGQREDDDRFEIAHESLIRYWKDLRDWLDEERGNMLQRLRLTDRAEEWQENGKDKSFLLPASVLAAYRSFKDLSLLEQEFIRCSLQESKERLA